LCAALVAMLSSVGHADEAAENIAAARTLGIQGVQLADAGKCPEAIEKLTRAEALHHAPTILSRLGECQVNVGEVVNGTENLNMVVREELPASAPKVFREAQKRAKKVLNAAMPKIAYLTIRVTPSEVKANVSVAGKAVPAALLGAERPTDPGTHQVSAAAEGYKPASATITLGEGAHQELSLLLEKDSSAVSALPAISMHRESVRQRLTIVLTAIYAPHRVRWERNPHPYSRDGNRQCSMGDFMRSEGVARVTFVDLEM